MTTGFELWNADIAGSLVPWAVAAGALIVALVSAERTNVWKRRYEDQDTENADLRDALADARYERTARQQPVDLTEWADPEPDIEPVGSPRRRHWHTRLTWPGLNSGRLPLDYGDDLDPARLEVDPCLRPVAPDGDELREWILTERLFDTLDDESGWSVAALPPPVHPRSPFTTPARPALTITQELEALCA